MGTTFPRRLVEAFPFEAGEVAITEATRAFWHPRGSWIAQLQVVITFSANESRRLRSLRKRYHMKDGLGLLPLVS